jgi:preprotein translocase subunit SecD/SecD/SecF fusion protein
MALAAVALLVAVSWWQLLTPPEAAEGETPPTAIALGLDLRGGLSVILTAEPLGNTPVTAEQMSRVETILIERVNGFGVSEATVQRQGAESFLIQLPGVSDPEQALEALGSPGRLEFVDLASITDTATLAALVDLPAREAAGENTTLTAGTYEPFMTGEVITRAVVVTDQFGNPAVSVSMSSEGIKTWAGVTTRLAPLRGQIAIVLDGFVKSAPAVQEPILSGDTQITGTFSIDEARRLAAVLESGALPVDLKVEESRVVGPTLGQESLSQGLFAALVGLGLVGVFMAVYYRGLGVIAWAALAVFGSLFLGVLAILSKSGAFALSLPGIAGTVLTIGMAADSTILILERFKEEIRLGKTYRSAAKSGTGHAIGTSLDANIVTFVSALAIYALAIGPVKGFAFTLMVGIAIGVFVMVFFTRSTMIMIAESVIAKAPALFGVKAGDRDA